MKWDWYGFFAALWETKWGRGAEIAHGCQYWCKNPETPPGEPNPHPKTLLLVTA